MTKYKYIENYMNLMTVQWLCFVYEIANKYYMYFILIVI